MSRARSATLRGTPNGAEANPPHRRTSGQRRCCPKYSNSHSQPAQLMRSVSAYNELSISSELIEDLDHPFTKKPIIESELACAFCEPREESMLTGPCARSFCHPRPCRRDGNCAGVQLLWARCGQAPPSVLVDLWNEVRSPWFIDQHENRTGKSHQLYRRRSSPGASSCALTIRHRRMQSRQLEPTALRAPAARGGWRQQEPSVRNSDENDALERFRKSPGMITMKSNKGDNVALAFSF